MFSLRARGKAPTPFRLSPLNQMISVPTVKPSRDNGYELPAVYLDLLQVVFLCTEISEILSFIKKLYLLPAESQSFPHRTRSALINMLPKLSATFTS